MTVAMFVLVGPKQSTKRAHPSFYREANLHHEEGQKNYMAAPVTIYWTAASYQDPFDCIPSITVCARYFTVPGACMQTCRRP